MPPILIVPDRVDYAPYEQERPANSEEDGGSEEEGGKNGAAKRTRTSTRVTGLAPQASASTNSAMAAAFDAVMKHNRTWYGSVV